MATVDLHLTPAEERSILADGRRHVLKSAPCGRAWDTFWVGGKQFEIIDVSERPVSVIASRYYFMEDGGSPGDLVRRRKAGHSGERDPDRKTYIHWFREINGYCQNGSTRKAGQA
jgi:hypothetical protein